MVDFERAKHVTRLRDLLRDSFKGEASIGPEEWDSLLLRVAGKVFDAGWRQAVYQRTDQDDNG